MTYPDAKETKREITATTDLGVAWFTETERKIHAIGDEIVDQRSRPFAGAWVQADPDGAALAAGVAVAMKATLGAGGAQYMVLATAAALAAGAVPLGVLVMATLPGALGLVATSGMLPPDGLGLGAGAASPVRANATTGILERATYPASSDAVVGECTALGALLVRVAKREPPIVKSAGGLGGRIDLGVFEKSAAGTGVGEILALIDVVQFFGVTPATIMVECDFVALTDDAANCYSSKTMATYRWSGAALNLIGSAVDVFIGDDTGSASGGIWATATAIKLVIDSVADWRWSVAVRMTYVRLNP